MDLEQDLDRLYQAKPGAFVSERNDLVRKLRQAGQRDDAARVAGLPRPTPVAWAVNQLHFRAKDELAALEAAGAALKESQESLGDSEEFARHKREHQQALRAAADRSLELCEEGGVATSVTLRRRIEMTLNLLSATPGVEPAPGRLSVELEPLGFDSLTISPSPAAPRPKPTVSAAADAEEKARIVALRTEIAALEQRLPELEHVAERARVRYREADQRSTEANRQAEEAGRAREVALRDANDAQKELEELRRALDQGRRRLP